MSINKYGTALRHIMVGNTPDTECFVYGISFCNEDVCYVLARNLHDNTLEEVSIKFIKIKEGVD